MREQLLKLGELQKIDIEIDQRRKLLAALDDGTQAKAEVEELTARLAVVTKKKEKIEGEHFDKDLELKTIEGKKKKAEDLMYSGKVRNLKELEDLQMEVAAFGREIDRLSTRALELMEELEAVRKEVKDCKAALEQAQAKLTETLDKFAADCAQMKAEIAARQAQMQELTPTITPALLERYKKMQARSGLVVVSDVEDDVCGACHTAVPNNLLTAVRASTTIQVCDSCGRMLVWTGEED